MASSDCILGLSEMTARSIYYLFNFVMSDRAELRLTLISSGHYLADCGQFSIHARSLMTDLFHCSEAAWHHLCALRLADAGGLRHCRANAGVHNHSTRKRRRLSTVRFAIQYLQSRYHLPHSSYCWRRCLRCRLHYLLANAATGTETIS